MIFRRRRQNGDLAEEPQTREQMFEAIEELTRENRSRRDPELDRRLLRLRHRVATGLAEESARRPDLPEPAFDALPNGSGLPVVAAEELTPELLRAGILRDGCVFVRGLVDPDEAKWLAGEIDRAFDAAEAHAAGAPRDDGYFEEFEPDPPFNLQAERVWVSGGAGVWIADSPRLTFDLLDVFERTGLQRLITGYLGERPALSVNKGTLRRVPPDIDTVRASAWHQDGAFLGDVRAVNVWLSLSKCGVDAPGLDIVPRRLDQIVETGTEGAVFDWSVSQAKAEEAAGATKIIRPEFEPGDVLLFDELFLHATAADPRMAHTRYAVESWFFGPSGFPEDYVPLAF